MEKEETLTERIDRRENRQKKYEPVNFGKAMTDLKTMLTTMYDMKQVKKSYDYTGEDITHFSILANSSNIKESVNAAGMKYNSGQGRDALDVIICKIFQLGYTQAMIEEGNDEAKNFLVAIAGARLDEFAKAQEKLKKLKKQKPDNGTATQTKNTKRITNGPNTADQRKRGAAKGNVKS